MRCLWFWGNFGQPVSWSSGLCSCVTGEFAWYVLPWNLLALVWCLVSVQVWRHLMSFCQLMFLGVRSSLESGFGLKPPVSSYQSYFYSSFKASPSIQHHWQNIYIKDEKFTMRVTQRGSQRYMEKRRGRRELEVTRMRWGGINRGESGLASNLFLMCTPQLTAQSCSWSYTEKRGRRKVTEVARRIKGGNEKEGDRSSQ